MSWKLQNELVNFVQYFFVFDKCQLSSTNEMKLKIQLHTLKIEQQMDFRKFMAHIHL
jgi:hypothetical protein